MSERRITVADCLHAVSEETFVSMTDLLSDRRSRYCARPRQIAMWAARKTTLCSLPVIGRMIGGRDHTTVIHAIKLIEHLRERQPAIRDMCDRVVRRVTADPRQAEMAV